MHIEIPRLVIDLAKAWGYDNKLCYPIYNDDNTSEVKNIDLSNFPENCSIEGTVYQLKIEVPNPTNTTMIFGWLIPSA
jgi:hypothetical protein